MPFRSAEFLPSVARHGLVMGDREAPDTDHAVREGQVFLGVYLGRRVFARERVDRWKHTVVDGDRQPPLATALHEPMKDDPQMSFGRGKRLVDVLSPLPRIMPVSAIHPVKLLPKDDRAVTAQQVGVRYSRAVLDKRDFPSVGFGNLVEIPARAGKHAVVARQDCQTPTLRKAGALQAETETPQIVVGAFFARVAATRTKGLDQRVPIHARAIV